MKLFLTSRCIMMACEKEMACCVRGYHVYKDTWAAATGEVLARRREPTNAAVRSNFQSYVLLVRASFLLAWLDDLQHFLVGRRYSC